MSTPETRDRTEHATPIEGVQLVVDHHGDPAGPPVLWLHSEFGALGDLPLGTVGRDARIIAPHLPGWGVSSDVGFRRIDELALLTWWLVDDLGLHRLVVAGHGLGAALAVELAIQQPTRVDALVLAAPYGIVDDTDPGVDIFGLTPGDLMPHLYAEPTGTTATTHFPRPSDAHEAGLSAIRRVQVLGAASRYLFPLPDTDVVARAYRIAGIPTTIVFGDRDGAVPLSVVEHWRRALPAAEIVIVAGGSHMHPYERGDLGEALAARLAAPAAR